MVRAKFRVVQTAIDHVGGSTKEGSTLHTVTLRAVYDPDPNSENGRFFAATPSGEVKLSTIRPEPASTFLIGKFYYLDFTPADD